MRHITTVILSVTCGVLAALAIIGLFELGFRLYASTLPQYDGKTTVEAENGSQLTITPTIQELIRQSNKASDLPEWVR